MAEVRLCRDCRYIVEADHTQRCGNPKQPIYDFVNGNLTHCDVARLDPGKLPFPNMLNCGCSGQWFEPKEE